MKSYIIVFLFSLSTKILCETTTTYANFLPCRLEWKPIAFGSQVPKDAVVIDDVTADTNATYIVKSSTNGTEAIGTYDLSYDFPLLPLDIIYVNTSAQVILQVLTNPYECNLTWTSSPFMGESGALPVCPSFPCEDGNSLLHVGRTILDGSYQAGQVRRNAHEIEIGESDEEGNGTFITRLPSFQRLFSWSDDLELLLLNFQFEDDPFNANPSFIGMEEIQNLANTTLMQTVTHSKRVRQTTTITISETWTSTYTKTVKLNLVFYKKTKTETKTVSRTETTSVTTIDETDIEMSKQVLVPPFTQIQICSVVRMRENFVAQYTATGKYSTKGLPPQMIWDILDRDNITGHWVEGEDVLLEVEGEMSGSVALSSEFIVAPLDSKDGCSVIVMDLSKRIQQRRKHDKHDEL